MLFDKGLNDFWVKPEQVTRLDKDNLLIGIQEPLNRSWQKEIVKYPTPGPVEKVSFSEQDCAFQMSDGELAIQVEDLSPAEFREYHVALSSDEVSCGGGEEAISIAEEETTTVISNGKISLKVPKTRSFAGEETVPGPIIAVKVLDGEWFGEGTLELSNVVPDSVETTVVEAGQLWTTIEVRYSFPDDDFYTVRIKIFPEESHVEVAEASTLPVSLRPAPRPYREIGSLGASFWDQPLEKLAKPCLRQFPDCSFNFDLSSGFRPDRLQTHSTASWEIMDLPLHSETLKTYTVMRQVNPCMDGGWMCFYSSNGDHVIGFASIDLCHWQAPDEILHPAHRTPGSSAEVICLNSEDKGTFVHFPIQNVKRSWVLNLTRKKTHPGFFTVSEPGQPPLKQDADPQHPTWALRNRLGDYRLDKVKDWTVDWPQDAVSHPLLLCKSSDFENIREKVNSIPEMNDYHQKSKHLHSSDRWILDGEKSGLAAIENTTHAKQLVENMLNLGYIGPHYAIGLARPLRRYVIACDLEWDSFSDEEKAEARRVSALAGYILSDGDYWQYAWNPGETTYLPNFNTDVFTCYGFIGMFLQDHPCSQVWIDALVKRLEIDLKYHVREDGCGEENLGNYNISSWTQLWMPAFWALKHLGIRDFSHDPRIHAAARFFLDAIGPPDPRDDYKRSAPPIGHHPMAKKDIQITTWLANFLREANPELTANLMWLWNETGRPLRANGDHSGPEGDPHSLVLIYCDPSIQSAPYQQHSMEFPHVGAVLHSHTDTRQGSFLVVKAGRVHSHHDADEGSFHYVGRGVPLAVDGLPLVNITHDESAEKHNVINFDKPGQPTGIIEKFATCPECDYIRANIKPRFFACDAMYVDDNHRSGFVREFILVKSELPGGIEYLVIKDTVTGPDSCHWNLDVLSEKPAEFEKNRIWFPGHQEEGFQMGLDVAILEPAQAQIRFEEGILGKEYRVPPGERELKESHVDWTVVEHWMMHIDADPGTTFFTVLFPRRESETPPEIDYNEREEVVTVTHDEGKDIIFMRSHNRVAVIVENIRFQGRSGIACWRNGVPFVKVLDGETIGSCAESWHIEIV